MGGLLHLIQRGGDWAGPQPAQAPPRCTKCNGPPINGQCTNFILFDVHYDDVDYVTAMIEDKSLSEVIKCRCINFMKATPLTGNSVLCNVCF